MERFTIRDNALMLNSILQMIPITVIALFIMTQPTNHVAWCFAVVGVMGSLTTNILGVASYETDKNYYGMYGEIAKKYNLIAFASVVSTYLALDIYMIEQANYSVIRLYTIFMINAITMYYLKYKFT